MIKRTVATVLVLQALAVPGFAASKKEKDCGYQADVVAAVQAARMARVAERKVPETVLAGEVSWPERYNNAIPLFTAEIYKLKRRDLKDVDLGAQWKETCLAN